ncbi:flagellar protein [Selenomonas flueggei]|uniref:flagellar protein n=1 Tax=Selenomonas flueggei TaxID=135080 RepID=UPI0026733A82|nr:flagellar protein [Selenomonas flueggei]
MAGKMKNCSSCGKVFIAINNSRVCPDCREKEEQWEKEIIEYVREHPKSQIPEIVEATGVQEPIIRRMIREGRFLSSNVELFYPCEKCGSPIQKGQYCDKCQKEMREELQSAIGKQSASGMRTAKDGSGRRGYVTLGGK